MEATRNLQQTPLHRPINPALGKPAIGAMFLSLFGTMWLVLGCLANSRPFHLAAACAGLIGIVLFGAAFAAGRELKKKFPRSGEPTEAERSRDRIFGRINSIQWAAAGMSVVILNVIGHPEWIMISIILIVGLHFFPLARLFKTRSHTVLGAIVVFIALVLPPFVGGPQSVVLPLAMGCVLLAFALFALYQAWLQLRG